MNKKIRIHTLLHAPFEGIACIADWIVENKLPYSETHFWEDDKLPQMEDFDMLIIMGGPMSVNDEKKYPWLFDEKNFIDESINLGKQILGICLGSQLIANMLGASVYPNDHKEIGWFPIDVNENAANTNLHFLPKQFMTFHWHGDTFDLPNGATHIAKSEATVNQAFTYGDNIVGLQFHPEMTQASMREMLKNGSSELVSAPYVQSLDMIMNNLHYADDGNKLLNHLLKEMANNFYKQQLMHVL